MKPHLHTAVRYGAMSYPDSGPDSNTVKLTEQIAQLQQVQQTTVSNIQSSVDCNTKELLQKISTIDKAQTDAINRLYEENRQIKKLYSDTLSKLNELHVKFNAIQSKEGEYKLSTAYIGSDGYKATIPKQIDGSQVSLAVEGKVIISNPDVVDKAQVNSKQTGLLYKPVMWNAATQSLCIVP